MALPKRGLGRGLDALLGDVSHKEEKMAVTKSRAVINSTNGYWTEIVAPQHFARPRSSSQPNNGTLNQPGIFCPQAQCEGGLIIDSPLGRR